MPRLSAAVVTGVLGLILGAAPAWAEEGAAGPAPKAPAPAGPSAILQLLNRQDVPMESSLKESLRPDVAPVPASRLDAPERMPDGSVRYGRTRVNVKMNADCPDDPFHEMAPPPARRAR
ncbi:MAG TPA: hypothetical protein VJU81_02555 [Methylomirabilota bacterium]|nr:hypothetical protein [Methylomirabilota bacterium]